MSSFSKLTVLLEMIKFEHTLFALPFALASAIVAAHGIPAWGTLGWILLAMVGARSAAMGFNRIADRHIDAQNTRTKNRALPAKLVSLPEAWVLVLVSSALFIFAAAMLNPLAFELSPVVLLIVLGYSYTKRFTSLSHMVLGLCLGIAPVGAWIAVCGTLFTREGTFEWSPIILAAAVTLWTAGFDILYSLQDIDFDKRTGLFSIPKRFGIRNSLFIARIMHLIAALLLVVLGWAAGLGGVYFAGVAAIALSLIYEHALVKPDDLSKINSAFFKMNGIVSVVFFIFTLADILLRACPIIW